MTPNKDAWLELASCRNEPTATFYPHELEEKDLIERARAICARCPVRDECLRDALAHHDEYGIRAGLLPEQRAHLRLRTKSA